MPGETKTGIREGILAHFLAMKWEAQDVEARESGFAGLIHTKGSNNCEEFAVDPGRPRQPIVSQPCTPRQAVRTRLGMAYA